MILDKRDVERLEKILGRTPTIHGEAIILGLEYETGTLIDPADWRQKGQLFLDFGERGDSTLEGMEKQGYNFLQDWTMDEPVTPERVVMPSGRIMDAEEIYDAARKGDVEAQDAEFFYVHHVARMTLDEKERFFPSYSFIDKKDVQACKEKYQRAG